MSHSEERMKNMSRRRYVLYTYQNATGRPDKLVFEGNKDEFILFLQDRYPKARVTKRISRWQVSRIVENDYIFYIDGIRQFGGIAGSPIEILKEAEN